jgi:hypothetical protein
MFRSLCYKLRRPAIAAAFILTSGAHCQAGFLWWASQVALVGATAADAASSWHQKELNPILAGPGGRFGGRGLAIKGATIGVTLSLENILALRAHKRPKALAIVNLAAAGVTGATAARNWGMK